MSMFLKFFTQERLINIQFFKKYIVYKIPLNSDMLKKIVDIKIVDNELIIKAEIFKNLFMK